jgi:hypothetical protein
MDGLPVEATMIDPTLVEVGANLTHQRLVYGKVLDDQASAVLVAQLIEDHPAGAGVVGRFYGTRLNGLRLGDVFRPWSSEGLGEVRWDGERREWVQVGRVTA